MTVILWDRGAQNVVMQSGRALTFKDSAAADVYLARAATARKNEKTPTTIDKVTVQ